jgi:hypothetical protein
LIITLHFSYRRLTFQYNNTRDSSLILCCQRGKVSPSVNTPKNTITISHSFIM